jgi:hypothetical protein
LGHPQYIKLIDIGKISPFFSYLDWWYNILMKYLKNALNQAGQTSVEYILLISVIFFVSQAVFKKLEGYLLTNPDSFKNEYLGAYKNMFNGGRVNSQYKWFLVRR